MNEKLLGGDVPSQSFILGWMDNNYDIDISYQMSPDVPSCNDYISSDNVDINYKSIIRSLIGTSLFLPLYVMYMVSDVRIKYPNVLSRTKALILFIVSILFSVFFWTTLGLWFSYNSKWKNPIPSQEIFFIVVIYFICCCAESVIQSSSFTRDDTYLSFKQSFNEIYVDNGNTTLNNVISMMLQQTITENTKNGVKYLGIFISIVYSISSELYKIILGKFYEDNHQIVFVIFYTFIKCCLCYFIIHYMSEIIIQLLQRHKQMEYFGFLTSQHQSTRYDLPFIKLDSRKSISNWQLIRATILYEYQQPKLFINIILSTSFIILLFSLSISGFYIFKYKILDHLAINMLVICIIIFIYIMYCIILAIKIMEGFNQTDCLYTAKLRMLHLSEEASEEYERILSILKTLQDLISNKKNVIIFKILGISITKELATVFFTFIFSALSSFVSNIIF